MMDAVTTHRPFVATLVLTLILGPLVQAVLPIPADPLKAGRFDENLYYVQRTHDTSLVDMVLVGDSRVQRGIDPDTMASILTNTRIANMGYSNGSVDNEMLDFSVARLDPQGQKVLVLGIASITFTHLTEGNAQLHEFQNKPRDDVWLAKYAPQVARAFKPVEFVTVARALLGHPYIPPSLYLQKFHTNGWMESDLIPIDTTRTNQSYRDGLSHNPYLPARELQTLERVRTLVAEGHRVFALRMPIAENLLQIESELSQFNWATFQLAFTEMGGIWLSPPGAPWGTYDGSHLSSLEAKRYSNALAVAMQPYLSLGRRP